MKILRYVKKGNNNYQIEFDNGLCVKLNEDLILKYNLLYKKEMDQDEVNKLTLLNKKYDIYNKCVKYICVRLRSINELKEYMHRQGIDDEYMEEIIEKLVKNGLLDDRKFALAFTDQTTLLASRTLQRSAISLSLIQVIALYLLPFSCDIWSFVIKSYTPKPIPLVSKTKSVH